MPDPIVADTPPTKVPVVYTMDGTEIPGDTLSIDVPTPVSTKPGPTPQTMVTELHPVHQALIAALCEGATTYGAQARALGVSESYIGRLWQCIRERTGLPNDDAVAMWAVPQMDAARAAAKTEAKAERAARPAPARSAGRGDQAQ